MFSDRLRAEAPEVMRYLRRHMGIRHIVVLSGDTHSAAAAVGERLQANAAYGDCLPRDKGVHVERLRKAGRNVMFVGVSGNKSAALSSAHRSLCLL